MKKMSIGLARPAIQLKDEAVASRSIRAASIPSEPQPVRRAKNVRIALNGLTFSDYVTGIGDGLAFSFTTPAINNSPVVLKMPKGSSTTSATPWFALPAGKYELVIYSWKANGAVGTSAYTL